MPDDADGKLFYHRDTARQPGNGKKENASVRVEDKRGQAHCKDESHAHHSIGIGESREEDQHFDGSHIYDYHPPTAIHAFLRSPPPSGATRIPHLRLSAPSPSEGKVKYYS
jgi:hypothetical protein